MGSGAVNKKAAPRKEVVRVEKTGSWGQVEWLHHLECGHVESRKRKSSTKVLACTGCVLAERYENQQKQQIQLVDQTDFDEELLDQLGSQLAVGERSVAQIRAALAARFAVPDDAIEVVVDDESGSLGVSYAVVLLTADEIRRVIA